VKLDVTGAGYLAVAPDNRLVIGGGEAGSHIARFFQEKSKLTIETKEFGSEARPRDGSVLITRDSADLPVRVYLNVDGNATLNQDYTTNLSGINAMARSATKRGFNLGGSKIGKILGGDGTIRIPDIELQTFPYIDMAAGQKSVAVRINTNQDSVMEPLEAAAFTLVPDLAYSFESDVNMATIPIEDDDSVHINFQTSNRFPPPTYAADLGTVYGDRGAGLTFGWDADNTATRAAGATTARLTRATTRSTTCSSTVPIASGRSLLPNGMYQVRIVAGDPSKTTRSSR
jgi:hypothetical protein